MKKLTLSLSICAAAFIIGCGGGGGGSNSGSSASTTTNNSGEATDELMVNADVTIYAGNINGKVLAKTKTDENGTYNVTLNYKGPILVEVKCDENTTLKDFNGTDLGECNLTTPLYSANIIEDANDVITAATPFSTAVVFAATEGNLSKTITKEALEKARTAVAQAYNLDIDPIAVNPTQSSKYQTKIKEFDKLDSNHTALIKQIIEDAKDGTTIGDDLNSSLKKDLNVTEVNVSDVDISKAPILTAKSTFDVLRTTINNISNSDETGSVDKEIQKINDDFETITVDVNSAIDPLSKVISMIADKESFKRFDDMDISVNTDDNQTFTYTINRQDTNYTGNIVFNENIYKDVDFSQNFDYTATIKDAELPYSDDNIDKKQILNADVELKNDASAKKLYLTLNNISLTSDEETLNINKIDASLNYTLDDDGDITPKYAKINTIQLSGNVLDKYDANLTINIPSYTTTKSNVGFVMKDIAGEVHCLDDEGNILDEKPEGYVKYRAKDGSLITLGIDNSWDNGFWFEQVIDPDQYDGLRDENFDLSDVSCPTGQPYITQREEEDDEFYNGGLVPNKISLNGDIKDLNNSMELIGNITVQSPDIDKIDLTKEKQYFYTNTVANVILKRPEYADTKLYINGVYKSENGPRKLEINFKYGDYDYINLLAKWNAGSYAGIVTITGLNGFKTTIPVNENGDPDFTNPIPVYVNNEKVGELQRNGDSYRIKYNDGTFESLQ